MGTMVKNLAPQLIRSSAERQPISALCLDDSSGPIRTVNLKDIHQLSQFFPLVVLIPKSYVKDQVALPKTLAASLRQKSGASKLLRQLSKTKQQYRNTNANAEFVFGDTAVNFSAMEAWRNGEAVSVTAMEFKVLDYMVRNERRVISRHELLNEVWGYENYPCTRTVDNHILKLRQKFERDPSRPVHFRTVHGAGYKFLPDQV